MIPRSALVVTLATAAIAAVSTGSASAAPGYRVTAIERLTSGAAGATPNLGLLARIDDGTGGPAPYATGEVTWTVDRRQLGVGAVDALIGAPAGTQFGWVTSGPTGGTAVQMPLRKTGVEVEAGTVIEADAEIPSEFAPVVGATVPVTIRVDPQQLLVRLNVQAAVRRFRASGTGDVILDLVGVYLLGGYASGGGTQHIAVNPTSPVNLELGVTAKPCGDASCARLGDPVADALDLTLPKTVTVRAPRRATYGGKTTFSGTATPGDKIHLAYFRASGAQPSCTPTSVNQLPSCSPRYAPTYDRLVETTTANSSGHWSLPVALRSVLINGSLGIAHPASGRYVAVVYKGDPPPGDSSFNGGRFSIFAAADADTQVALAKPRVTVSRDNSSPRVVVSVPGGDAFVHVQLKLRRAIVAAGQLDAAGVFRTKLPRFAGSAALEVTASVPGARSSSTRVGLHRRSLRYATPVTTARAQTLSAQWPHGAARHRRRTHEVTA